MFFVEVKQFVALEVRVELNLIAGGCHLRCLEDGFEMLWQEIRDADGFGEACFFQLFHSGPGGLEFLI